MTFVKFEFAFWRFNSQEESVRIQKIAAISKEIWGISKTLNDLCFELGMSKLWLMRTVFVCLCWQGICDGAAALIVVSEKALKEHNFTPLARIVSYAVSGVEPSIMGIGPVPSVKEALNKAGKTLQDMQLIEVTFQ